MARTYSRSSHSGAGSHRSGRNYLSCQSLLVLTSDPSKNIRGDKRLIDGSGVGDSTAQTVTGQRHCEGLILARFSRCEDLGTGGRTYLRNRPEASKAANSGRGIVAGYVTKLGAVCISSSPPMIPNHALDKYRERESIPPHGSKPRR